MADNIIDEYLISLKPSVNMSHWADVVGKVKQTISTGLKNLYTGADKLEGLDPDSEEYKKQLKLVEQRNANLQSASMYLSLFSEAVDYAKETALKFADKAVEASQKFVTQSSIFVDSGTRDTMGKYGVDSMRAQSINAASEGLGISMSDYAKLTQGTREAFADLMSHYEAGLRSIDTDKLDTFNKMVNEYQLSTVKFEMDMQILLTKMLTESDALPELLEVFTDAMSDITSLMSSDAFKVGADILISLIKGILEFASAPLDFGARLAGLFGGSSSSSSSQTVEKVSTQQSIDLGLQLQTAMTR